MKWTDAGSGQFEQPPIGTHAARCIRLIDIGTHKQEYEGVVSFPRQNILTWELPTVLMERGDSAGKPFIVSNFYTASLNEKATLRKHLASWRGRDFTEAELQGFDPRNLLGKPCLLTVGLNKKGKAKVLAITGMPKGFEVPEAVNPQVFFSLEDFDQKTFDLLSDGLKKMIVESPEYEKLHHHDEQPQDQPAHGFEDMEDSIPF